MILLLLTVLALLGVSAMFFGLASNHGKSPLLYAIIGIVVFLGSILFIDGIILSIFNVEIVHIIFGSYPIGLLGCWLLFTRLKKSWSREKSVHKAGALDDGLTDQQR